MEPTNTNNATGPDFTLNRSSQPAKPPQICQADGCKRKLNFIRRSSSLKCPYCKKSFCQLHAMPEDHNQDCVQKAQRLAREKLKQQFNLSDHRNKRGPQEGEGPGSGGFIAAH